MRQFQQLQSDFFQALLEPQLNAPKQVLPSLTLDANQRMKLYQDAYRLRLVEALCDTFPSLHTLAGDELFENICLDYIKANPSQHFSIRYFGNELANFLATQKQYQEIPILNEMAHFEWLLRNAFDGPNALPLQRTELGIYSMDEWPQLCFQLLPTYARIELEWNTPQLWKAIEQDLAAQEPQQLQNKVSWIIWRPELDTKFRSVDEVEAFALAQIERQVNFSELCDALDTYGITEPAQTVAGLLTRWLEEGLIASTTLSA